MEEAAQFKNKAPADPRTVKSARPGGRALDHDLPDLCRDDAEDLPILAGTTRARPDLADGPVLSNRPGWIE